MLSSSGSSSGRRVAQKRLHRNGICQLRRLVHDDDVLDPSLLAHCRRSCHTACGWRQRRRALRNCCRTNRHWSAGLRRVNRHIHSAQQQACKVGDGPLRPVLAQNRNAIAFADAPGTAVGERWRKPSSAAGERRLASTRHSRGSSITRSLLRSTRVKKTSLRVRRFMAVGPVPHAIQKNVDHHIGNMRQRKFVTAQHPGCDHLIQRAEKAVRGILVRHLAPESSARLTLV